MIPMKKLKKLVAERKKLEADVSQEVSQEKKEYSVSEGKKFEKQMIKQEEAKIRHLKIEKKIGKYARKGYTLIQKGKGAVQTGKKVHGRISRGLSVMEKVAGQFEKGLHPPKGIGPKKKKSKSRKRNSRPKSAFGFDLPF